MKRGYLRWVFLGLLLQSSLLQAQDIKYATRMMDTLASPSFHGRGYIDDGMLEASAFIAGQFQQIGLDKLPGNENYFQDFAFPVNTFPGKISCAIDSKKLVPGKDFILDPSSDFANGTFKLKRLDSTDFVNPDKIVLADDEVPVMNMDQVHNKDIKKQMEKFLQLEAPTKPVILLEKKLTWSVAQEHDVKALVEMIDSVYPAGAQKLSLHFKTRIIPNFHARNVTGMVKGTQYPDSFVVITAHYDHLGMMGKRAMFRGANDNASGSAMLLDMARHFKAHPAKYSVVFISFAAEEAGLLGSRFFSEYPLIDLTKIKVLINLDLMGSGLDGIAIVNGKAFPGWMKLLDEINLKDHLVKRIKIRGNAPDSDHYWFVKKGVPAFFIYSLGEITAYHDVFDTPKVVTFSRYNEMFKLITQFIRQI